jgi:hypothetical protein
VATLGFFAVAAVLWLGPGALALWLSRGRSAWPRRIYWLGAACAFTPVALLEASVVIGTLQSYDGFCHHAPDIRFPCSPLAAVLDAAFPMSAFGLFGLLMLGAPAFVVGALATGAAHWFAGVSLQRSRVNSS